MVLEPVKTFGRIPTEYRTEAYALAQEKLIGAGDPQIKFMAIMEYNALILPRENSKNGNL